MIDMEYNTQKSLLRVPDYGRNVQILVDFIVTIENKDERTRAAEGVVGLLAQQNPQMRNQPEFQQKLWDQLFIISDYKLDIDSPYPIPEKPEEDKVVKKRMVDYRKQDHKYHFYGENVELMIKRVLELDDEELKSKIIDSIAHYMKISYKTWNDEKVSDEIIIDHLKQLSKGEIIIDKMPETTKQPERNYNRDYNRNKRSKSHNKKHHNRG